MRRGTKTYTYICEDEGCLVMFQIFGLISGGRPHCPKCGYPFHVISQKGIHSTKEKVKNLKTRWKDEELSVLKRCIVGELKPYQVCIITGRSKDSVHKKLKRMGHS